MNPHDRILAGLAAQPEGARRRHKLRAPFHLNPTFERLLADPTSRERVMTPSLRMQLAMYEQAKQAYESEQEYTQ